MAAKDHLTPVTITVDKCPRCGRTHEAITLSPMRKPILVNRKKYQYWASCPNTGEPIIMRQEVVEDEH